jgi:hypothetical protein
MSYEDWAADLAASACFKADSTVDSCWNSRASPSISGIGSNGHDPPSLVPTTKAATASPAAGGSACPGKYSNHGLRL